MAMEVLEFMSKVTDNLLRVAKSFRIDVANREEAQKHEALAREQCQHQYAERQRQQAEEKEKILRQEANEREQRQAREALEWEQEAVKGKKITEGRISPRGETSKRGPSPKIKRVCVRRSPFANSC